jgi:hypothetical protein
MRCAYCRRPCPVTDRLTVVLGVAHALCALTLTVRKPKKETRA